MPVTLKEHLHELGIRLFAIGVAFVGVAAAAYPFFDKISHVITAPLKGNHELVYLTPGGAFSFIIKVCVYVGLVGALPVIIFNVYRFVMPAVKRANMRVALLYTTLSLTLAVAGVLFAYFISLPAALYFLTGFSIQNINPMLTIDSYFSFVMTYVLAGALLFQLPLIMLIINTITPLTPGKMMKYQGRIILGSFIVAAIITPTPDPLNQTLLAMPIVVMYQLGITLVWMANHKRRKQAKRAKLAMAKVPAPVAQPAGVMMTAPVSTQKRVVFSDITPHVRPVIRQASPVANSLRVASTVRVPVRPVLQQHQKTAPLFTSQTGVQRNMDGVITAPRHASSF